MSKLNDSTLKILKKYRLDTDMSVFGNENKLYDVVKVMDDMVGNQVSKYVGKVGYLSSINNQNATYYTATQSGTTKTFNTSINITTPKSLILFFDPFSLKYAGKIDETSSFMPVAKMYVNDNFVAYVVCNISTKDIFLSKNIGGSEPITVSINNGDTIHFITFLKLSNNTYSCSGGPDYFHSLFNFTFQTTSKLFPQSVSNIISLPEEILMLDITKKIYCGSDNSIAKVTPNLYSNSLSINTDIYLSEV